MISFFSSPVLDSRVWREVFLPWFLGRLTPNLICAQFHYHVLMFVLGFIHRWIANPIFPSRTLCRWDYPPQTWGGYFSSISLPKHLNCMKIVPYTSVAPGEPMAWCGFSPQEQLWAPGWQNLAPAPPWQKWSNLHTCFFTALLLLAWFTSPLALIPGERSLDWGH